MIFDALVIFAVLLIGAVLLFPVKVRVLFGADARARFLEVRLFCRRIWKWSNIDSEEKDLTENLAEEKHSAPAGDSAGKAREKSTDREDVSEARAVAPQGKPETFAEKASPKKSPEKNLSEERSDSREKSDPSDREFFSLMLEPKWDKKFLKGISRMGKAFARIFRLRFEPSIVEGVYWERFDQMGYAAGAFAFAKGTLPVLKNWTLSMDFENSRPLRVNGACAVSFSAARVIGFLLVSAKAILEVVWLYFKNRRRYRKNPEGFELSFWRRRLVRFLSA